MIFRSSFLAAAALLCAPVAARAEPLLIQTNRNDGVTKNDPKVHVVLSISEDGSKKELYTDDLLDEAPNTRLISLQVPDNDLKVIGAKVKAGSECVSVVITSLTMKDRVSAEPIVLFSDLWCSREILKERKRIDAEALQHTLQVKEKALELATAQKNAAVALADTAKADAKLAEAEKMVAEAEQKTTKAEAAAAALKAEQDLAKAKDEAVKAQESFDKALKDVLDGKEALRALRDDYETKDKNQAAKVAGILQKLAVHKKDKEDIRVLVANCERNRKKLQLDDISAEQTTVKALNQYIELIAEIDADCSDKLNDILARGENE